MIARLLVVVIADNAAGCSLVMSADVGVNRRASALFLPPSLAVAAVGDNERDLGGDTLDEASASSSSSSSSSAELMESSEERRSSTLLDDDVRSEEARSLLLLATSNYTDPATARLSLSLSFRLQSVQNAAARLITRTGRREHITPVLRELHWLPVRCRVDFKLATFMYKTLHGQIPR